MIRRVRFLVEPRVQIKIIALVMGINFFGLILFALSLHYYFQKFIEAAQIKGLPTDHLFYNYIGLQETAMWKIFAFVAAVSILISLVGSVLYSHRFVGPIQRLRRGLQDYTESGSWNALVFRKNDYMKDIGEQLNTILGRVQK